MKNHTTFALDRRTITFRGIPAILLLLGIFILPRLLVGSPEPAEAEERIRQYYLLEVIQQQMAEREAGGAEVLDEETALRWADEIERVDDMRFVSVEVKRAIFVPPFRRRTQFAVKAVIQDRGQEETRYFWFNGTRPGSVQESSRSEWFVPI